MDNLEEKETLLEKLSVEEEIEEKRMSIARKKALEREAKKEYGSNWKSVVYGAIKNVKVDKEALQTLYTSNGMRNLTNPNNLRRR